MHTLLTITQDKAFLVVRPTRRRQKPCNQERSRQMKALFPGQRRKEEFFGGGREGEGDDQVFKPELDRGFVFPQPPCNLERRPNLTPFVRTRRGLPRNPALPSHFFSPRQSWRERSFSAPPARQTRLEQYGFPCRPPRRPSPPGLRRSPRRPPLHPSASAGNCSSGDQGSQACVPQTIVSEGSRLFFSRRLSQPAESPAPPRLPGAFPSQLPPKRSITGVISGRSGAS